MKKNVENARLTAIEIIEDVFYRGAYSNLALKKKLNSSTLSVRDRALVTEIVYGTLRYKYTIDRILDKFLKNDIEKQNSFIKNVLRTSLYQIIYLDKIPEFAVVNEAVELSKKRYSRLSKLVNGVLRNFLRKRKSIELEEREDVEKLCFKYSFAPWMVNLFKSQYGIETAEAILKGLDCIPKVTVRVNRLKTNFTSCWNELVQNGYNLRKPELCSDAIVIDRGSDIEKNILFSKGMISVQDESAMLPVMAMDLEKNMTVIDVCSAPGGKTCYMAEVMENTGKVFAFDIYENKIKIIAKNAERLGIKNIEAGIFDACNCNLNMKERADRVLADVPCSGIGIIRKKPEIKWNKSMKQLENLIGVQRKIMQNSAEYVKPSGVFVYSTCTLNKNENEKNVEWFLKNNSEFTLEKLDFGRKDNIIYHRNGCVTVLPDENMDGFFVAKMIKHR